MSKINSFLGVMVMIFLFSCKKDYTDEPQIEFVEMSQTFLLQQVDSTIITFSFVDGDGDIGDDINDNIFIRDNRNDELLKTAKMPNYLEQSNTNYRKGTVSLTVKAPCCIFPNGTSCTTNPNFPLDTMRYLIQVQDRAGNLSNIIETSLVQVDCN